MHLTRQWYSLHFIQEGFTGTLILTERFHHLQVSMKMSVLSRSGFLKGVNLPLLPFWAGSVSSLSLWLDRLNRRWMRPRSLTLSSLSEDGMERLRSSSMDRSESESESSPGERRREEQMKKWNRCATPVRQMSKCVPLSIRMYLHLCGTWLHPGLLPPCGRGFAPKSDEPIDFL